MKQNIYFISHILYRNFDNSLVDSLFPSKPKEADITSIYKKEENYLKENYGPVCILPNISKVHERLMYDQINAYFETILSKVQCGFLKACTCNIS